MKKSDSCEEILKETLPVRIESRKSIKSNAVYSTGITALSQAQWHERDKVKQDIKSRLPMLTAAEVRRHRIPLHKAVLLEAKEDGFDETFSCLKRLYEIDEKMGKDSDSGYRLREHKKMIEELVHGLREAEEAKKNSELTNQVLVLSRTALFFQSTSLNWSWIANEVYIWALNISEKIQDNEKTITLIKFLYGRFLLNEMNDVAHALDNLSVARESSRNKNWRVSVIFPYNYSTIFKESSILMYNALLKLAKNLGEQDSMVLFNISLQLAKISNDCEEDELIINALFELGKSAKKAKQCEYALSVLFILLEMMKKSSNAEEICDVYLELASVYEKLGNSSNAERYFQLSRETALNLGLPIKYAHAQYQTGQYYLHQTRPKLATKYFEKAFKLYCDVNMRHYADKTRIFHTVSKGEEMIDKYSQLVYSLNNDLKIISQLCKWKSDRTLFS